MSNFYMCKLQDGSNLKLIKADTMIEAIKLYVEQVYQNYTDWKPPQTVVVLANHRLDEVSFRKYTVRTQVKVEYQVEEIQ